MLQITLREKVIGIFLIFALFALAVTQCNLNKKNAALDDVSARLAYANQTMDSLKNKNGQLIAEQKVVETQNANTIKQLSAEVFDLKKKDENNIKRVNALVRLSQRVKVDSVYVPYAVVDTAYIPSQDSTNYDNWVHVPKEISLDSNTLTLRGVVKKDGFQLNTLHISDTVSFRIAEKKAGFFAPRQTVVEAIHSSPFYQTTGMNSIVLKNKTSAWNRWIKPLIAGIAGSYLTYRVVK